VARWFQAGQRSGEMVSSRPKKCQYDMLAHTVPVPALCNIMRHVALLLSFDLNISSVICNVDDSVDYETDCLHGMLL